MFDVDHGIISNSTANINEALPIAAFVSVALYNVLELTSIILYSFKRRRGLYFWSFCLATGGIAPYSVAFLLKGLGSNPGDALYGYVTLIVVGWSCMVTGQSLVLYSRLHLVERSARTLSLVLAMIVTNGVVLHTTLSVLVFGSNSPVADRFLRPYSVMEKVQVTVFFVQECVISGLYIAATLRVFRHSPAVAARGGGRCEKRRMLRHLIMVNVLVILLDVTILALEYSGLYALQTAYKGMAYSVKLKLEFSVLNGLVNLTRATGSHGSDGHRDGPAPCVACREDRIYDGRLGHTCPGSVTRTLELEALDVAHAMHSKDAAGTNNNNNNNNTTTTSTKHRSTSNEQPLRKGSMTLDSEPAYSAVAYSVAPPAGAEHEQYHQEQQQSLGSGIMVMTETSVSVSRENEFERQWRMLRRVSNQSESESQSGSRGDDVLERSASDLHLSEKPDFSRTTSSEAGLARSSL